MPDPSKVTETLSDLEIMNLLIFLQDCPQVSLFPVGIRLALHIDDGSDEHHFWEERMLRSAGA